MGPRSVVNNSVLDDCSTIGVQTLGKFGGKKDPAIIASTLSYCFAPKFVLPWFFHPQYVD